MRSFADDDGHHFFIGKKFIARQVGDFLAALHRNDACRIARYQVHIVFYQHDCFNSHMFGGTQERLHDAVFIGGGYAGGRFIQQHDFRMQRESTGDVEQLATTVRQGAALGIEPWRQAECIGGTHHDIVDLAAAE